MNSKTRIGTFALFAVFLMATLLLSNCAAPTEMPAPTVTYRPTATETPTITASPTITTSPTPDPFGTITANPHEDWVDLGDYKPNSSYTLTIYESEGGPITFGPQSVVTDEEGGYFWGGDVLPAITIGTLIEIKSDDFGLVNTLQIANLTMDIVDLEGDIVIGTADPGQEVYVFASTEGSVESMFVETDHEGNWSANFGAIGFDLTGEHFVASIINEADGDSTYMH